MQHCAYLRSCLATPLIDLRPLLLSCKMLVRLLTSDFSDSDAGLRGCLKVHMVTANARGERQLQLLRLRDALGREVAGEEGRGDDLQSTCASATADSQQPCPAIGQHVQDAGVL